MRIAKSKERTSKKARKICRMRDLIGNTLLRYSSAAGHTIQWIYELSSQIPIHLNRCPVSLGAGVYFDLCFFTFKSLPNVSLTIIRVHSVIQ